MGDEPRVIVSASAHPERSRYASATAWVKRMLVIPRKYWLERAVNEYLRGVSACQACGMGVPVVEAEETTSKTA